MFDHKNYRIAVIGLGYVGLPLAIEFSKLYAVTGFDISKKRIAELSAGNDHTLEIDSAELQKQSAKQEAQNGLSFTSVTADIEYCNIYIVTVPTPVDQHNHPDLAQLRKASETVAGVLKKGDMVIYESTVYPGCTEEICVPLLENGSGLVFNTDFFCGYSPERINPGDKSKTLTKIQKITSGSTPEAANAIDKLYASIISAGTYPVSSIKVAESAKVIENAQRDINIAFVNELAKIFNVLNIDTHEVLAAAGTKWNFLPFLPGLVGGHCIGVDPYYLAQKAIAAGYYPEIILSGRRINDSMGSYVAGRVVKLMLQKEIPIFEADILILGITFKENCPDVRNTKVIDIIKELQSYKARITICDPWAGEEEVDREYGLKSTRNIQPGVHYHAVILAVGHHQFHHIDYRSLLHNPGVLFDVKGILDSSLVDGRL